MARYWFARCADCDMEIPFWIEAERDEWVDIHSEAIDATGKRHDSITTWEAQRMRAQER